MGRGRLPFKKALTRGTGALFLGVAVALACSGCLFGGDDDEQTPHPNDSSDRPAHPGPVPSPQPTPNRLATPPVSQADALDWLTALLDKRTACDDDVRQYGVGCVEGDIDGDGTNELAFIVPVTIPGSQLPYPSAVFVLRGKTQKLEEFSFDLTADSSLIGLSFFGLEDRNGDGQGDLTFLENRCGTTACMTTAVILTWDGTAWRDIAPTSAAVSNVDAAEWEEGEDAFTLHGGKLPAGASPEAGPSRASTSIFRLGSSRYELDEVKRDPPEYLYQAFLDADEVFEHDKAASIEAFESLLDQPELKDWKARPAQADRRPSLIGFALFRILLADAVQQRSSETITAAIDRLVLQSGSRDSNRSSSTSPRSSGRTTTRQPGCSAPALR